MGEFTFFHGNNNNFKKRKINFLLIIIRIASFEGITIIQESKQNVPSKYNNPTN